MMMSFGSRKILATMSKPCWEPVVMRMFSGLIEGFSCDSHFASSSRNGASPSVGPYCSAVAPFSRSSWHEMSSSSLTGKVSGAGNPPANEIMSGRRVTFRSSLISERFMFCAFFE